jgi:hypothetical protein
MIQDTAPISEISHAIQMAVAPVFLLSGVAALIGVLTTRLSRIIDRARVLEGQERAAGHPVPELHEELLHLSQRARLVSWSISLCTTSALTICALIAVLFIGNSLSFHVAQLVSVLFVFCMAALFTALVCFLREIYIATQAMRIGPK